MKDYAQSIRLRRSLTITAARELGLNVLSESSGDPQMNFTQLLDGVTGIEHSMGLHPFHDDVVQYWGGTKAGMTPTLLVGYNVPMGEGWYHQPASCGKIPSSRASSPPSSSCACAARAPVARGHGGAHDGETNCASCTATAPRCGWGRTGRCSASTRTGSWTCSSAAASPWAEVLEVATIKGAAQHGLDAQLGSLEVGKLADLVVLDANPLDDIANAQKIRYVMKNGVVFAGPMPRGVASGEGGAQAVLRGAVVRGVHACGVRAQL
ncbi:MAG: amidohydrolase family protein [Gemmatimonadetes bacterium]|nr:amidohydrolase family protein [Gemmatimonadota bacterium]